MTSYNDERGYVTPPRPTSDRANLLSDLPSLGRMNQRDQRMLDMRLRVLSAEAKRLGAISLAADLLRASYELEHAR
jgi:hypothetical protein